MTLLAMALQELRYRKGSFLASCGAVAHASATVAGSLILLHAYDRRDRAILQRRQEHTAAAAAALEDDIRKAMIQMGFNILILPADQPLAPVLLGESFSKTLPQEYVQRLSESKIINVNHLLPIVHEKIYWPAAGTAILLVGSSGEIPLAQTQDRTPILQPVRRGEMILGHQLFSDLGAADGAEVELMGRKFRIVRHYAPRDNLDDMTAWISLEDAQELLRRPGRINAILAVSCQCAGADVAKIRQEIQAILPDTQVREHGTKLLTRAEMRQRASDEAIRALEADRAGQAALHRSRRKLAGVLAPMVVGASAVWVGLLAWGNIRQRRCEIGLLRALGAGEVRIGAMLLLRAAAAGVAGGLAGLALTGAACAVAGADWRAAWAAWAGALAALALPGLALLALLSSVPPVLWAIRKDPADVLRAA